MGIAILRFYAWKMSFICQKQVLTLFLQGQIHQERLHLLIIIDNGICISNKGMFAHLVENNLYIMDIAGLSSFVFPSTNKKTLEI